VTVPHTADLRIEAWAPTRDGCIRASDARHCRELLDTSSSHPQRTCQRRLTGDSDDDLLVAVLEEVI
jgi:SHS2 domain-containing protein